MPSAWPSPSGISPRVSASDVVDHTTYVLACDGDLMEGISQEAIALAGHMKLKKLIVLYDDNQHFDRRRRSRLPIPSIR